MSINDLITVFAFRTFSIKFPILESGKLEIMIKSFNLNWISSNYPLKKIIKHQSKSKTLHSVIINQFIFIWSEDFHFIENKLPNNFISHFSPFKMKFCNFHFSIWNWNYSVIFWRLQFFCKFTFWVNEFLIFQLNWVKIFINRWLVWEGNLSGSGKWSRLKPKRKECALSYKYGNPYDFF